MRRLLIGFALGLAVGLASSGGAATLVGSNGYLLGWTVEVDGDEVCSDPYVWVSTRQIDC